jgi:hypothetical protein
VPGFTKDRPKEPDEGVRNDKNIRSREGARQESSSRWYSKVPGEVVWIGGPGQYLGVATREFFQAAIDEYIAKKEEEQPQKSENIPIASIDTKNTEKPIVMETPKVVKCRGRPAKKPVVRVSKPVVKPTVSSEKPKMTLSKQLKLAAAEGAATANTGCMTRSQAKK